MNPDSESLLSGRQQLDIEEAKKKAFDPHKNEKSEGFKVQKAKQFKNKVDNRRKRNKISKVSKKKNRKNK